MPKATKLVKVASKLEQELLAAVISGAASVSILNEKELSKEGRVIHNAVRQLVKNGLEPPIRLATIFTHAVSSLGGPPETLKPYLQTIQEITRGKDAAVLSKLAKQKEALVTILNEASKQLSSGDVSLRKFSE